MATEVNSHPATPSREALGVRSGNPPVRTLRPNALVVDLDGTLVKTDLLLESLLLLLHRKPQYSFLLLVWLLRGKAHFKRQITRRVVLDVRTLPYHEELLEYLKGQRTAGRTLVLATGADEQYARQVADHLKIFDSTFASDGRVNLSAKTKRDRLVVEFGEKGFDYAGNDRSDLVVWSSARKAIVVNPDRRVSSNIAKVAEVERVFDGKNHGAVEHLKALRPQQWLKNLLLFVPLLAAHRFDEPALFEKLVVAFLAFGCCASSGYLLNDIFDLNADRRHPRKRRRPFAAGNLPLSFALVMIPVLMCLSGVLGAAVSPLFLGVLACYFALTVTYSLFLKTIVLLDVMLLASLYTLRIIAGSAAVSIWPSYWLLAFSTFLFLSLALVKRYSELVAMQGIEGNRAKARAYESSDGELLAAMGTASGYLSVLVLALYITSGTAQELYARYELIWMLCPLLLYWISHVWLTAHRGKMHDDPLVFATKDRTSRVLILSMAVITLFAL
jgi:4-hydroxybenzoate polyprenyltransferase/phosphoserine phosphatase